MIVGAALAAMIVGEAVFGEVTAANGWAVGIGSKAGTNHMVVKVVVIVLVEGSAQIDSEGIYPLVEAPGNSRHRIEGKVVGHLNFEVVVVGHSGSGEEEEEELERLNIWAVVVAVYFAALVEVDGIVVDIVVVMGMADAPLAVAAAAAAEVLRSVAVPVVVAV